MKRALQIIAGLAVLTLLLLLLGWVIYPREIDVEAPFVAADLSIDTLDYYDLGAVDFDRDGKLDLFTTNHSSRQSLLIATADGGYRPMLSDLQLDQTAEFPGLEDIGTAPPMRVTGLYVYFIKSNLYIDYVADDASSISGEVSVPGRTEVSDLRGLSANVVPPDATAGASQIHFSGAADGGFSLAVTKSAPITVSVEGLPLDRVFVGARGINPTSASFELFLKDRHGIAWADINGDDALDAFMSRGALFGSLADLPGDFADQFFVSDAAGNYVDQSTALGFEKQDCPARQVAWVDVNSDNRLDLYIACGRQVGGFWEYVPVALRNDRDAAPNLLFIQGTDGRFTESAADMGLDFAVGGTFVWLDADSDGDSDLLWASEQEVSLYRNNRSKFTADILLPEATTLQVRKLALSDFDNDGDTDVFVAASIDSKLLVNEAGSFQVAEPGQFGLPGRVRTAAWVDTDNDGLVDFYAWPGGIYRQTDTAQFEPTGALRMPSPYWPIVDPRVLWFDSDNDGDRDIVVMQRFFPQVVQRMFPDALPFTVRFARNDTENPNAWIQFDLTGPPGNSAAIGTTIDVLTPNGRKRLEVGENENSHYSQGHYRLYLGLGNTENPVTAGVTWSDGTQQTFDHLALRQVHGIRYPPAPDSEANKAGSSVGAEQ